MKISAEAVSTFEKLTAQLKSSHQEMSTLAKKTPNGPLNPFKINLINGVLTRANAFLGEAYRPFPDFSTFAAESLPTNSDVSLVLSQYLECAEKYRADHLKCVHGDWYWDAYEMVEETDDDRDEYDDDEYDDDEFDDDTDDGGDEQDDDDLDEEQDEDGRDADDRTKTENGRSVDLTANALELREDSQSVAETHGAPALRPMIKKAVSIRTASPKKLSEK